MVNSLSTAVQRALNALPPEPRAAAERQLRYTSSCLDDQLEVIAEAWILGQQGLGQDKISQVIRDRQIRGRLDKRAAGRALEVDADAAGASLHHIDPAALLEAAQEIDAAQGRMPSGWAVPLGAGL